MQLNVDELLPVWVTWLPIYTDLDEVNEVYEFLCDRVEQ